MKKIILMGILFLGSGLLGFLLSWHQHQPKPIQVMETYHYPALFVSQLKNDPQAGKKIFQEFCAACHAPQPRIDIKAPRINDRKFWQGMAKLGDKKLLELTIEGTGAMPARGGCFECSDEQLLMAIHYIVNPAILP